MPIVSVITPVYRPVPEYLIAAYESLRDQQMPEGWQWEWLVQHDGAAAPHMLPHDERIIPAAGGRHGVAATRNLALARSRGEFVKNLDADDVLTPGVLGRDIHALADRTIGWAASKVLDLHHDGTTHAVDNDPPPGRIAAHTVVEAWRASDYRLPIHPASLCIRRELAVALGGWMGLPTSEDTGLLIAASTVADGFFHNEVGLLYRIWPGQTTRTAGHDARKERMALIDARARALAERISWRS